MEKKDKPRKKSCKNREVDVSEINRAPNKTQGNSRDILEQCITFTQNISSDSTIEELKLPPSFFDETLKFSHQSAIPELLEEEGDHPFADNNAQAAEE